MAYRELSVTEVLDVLRHWQKGMGFRTVADLVSVDRKTVRRYVEAAVTLGVARSGDASQLTDEVLGQVAQAVRPGRKSVPGAMRALCRKHRVVIESWLADDVLVTKVRTLLHRLSGVMVPERTLMRFVAEELGRTRRPQTTVRIVDGEPGQELQVDFCDLAWVVDPDTGRRRRLQAMLFTAVVSRHAFVWPCWDQSVDTVIEAMEAAWRFFGGVFHVVVPDNCKAIVTGADPLSPVFCRDFLAYAQSRGFTADPARVRSPQDKGRVERNVKYLQGSLMPGEKFLGMATTREMASSWCLTTAGHRDHGTTHKQPVVDFVEREQPLLLPLPGEAYDAPTWTTVTVRRDHTITVSSALYSMPTEHIGKTVGVEATRRTVKVWCKGVLLKTHARVAKGESSIDALDYPTGTAELATRDGAAQLRMAVTYGTAVGEYVSRLQMGPAPWQRMRHVYRLLGLCKTFGATPVDVACRTALDMDVVDVHRVGRMLALGLERAPAPAIHSQLALVIPLRFARSADEFALARPVLPTTGGPDERS